MEGLDTMSALTRLASVAANDRLTDADKVWCSRLARLMRSETRHGGAYRAAQQAYFACMARATYDPRGVATGEPQPEAFTQPDIRCSGREARALARLGHPGYMR